MDILDLIYVKRAGEVLSSDQIDYFVQTVVQQTAEKEQIAALLMAIYLQGMTDREISDLTLAMAQSGDYVAPGSFDKSIVDKHSTGGVGDKVTLVLVPLLRSMDLAIAKMSGRGLGHTGGTLDKLEVFPGFRHGLSHREFVAQVTQHGVALAGQTPRFVPADKILYALRDVTGTVESLPLIASSIMSKKIACGAACILLDVKVGSGATLSDPDEARQLAKLMVSIGQKLGRKTRAVLTDMSQPLGRTVGNALEVREAIETLSGQGPEDLTALCLTLGSHLLTMAQPHLSIADAAQALEENLTNGLALEALFRLIRLQGGQWSSPSDLSVLPEAPLTAPLLSEKDGYLSLLDARIIGEASMLAGAGRRSKTDEIDPAAGVVLHAKVGDHIATQTPVLTIHSSSRSKLEAALAHIKSAIAISEKSVKAPPLVLENIDS